MCQKRVLAIIYPSVDIADSLCHSEILKLSDRRLEVCNKLFNDIVITPTNNRGNLPPARHTPRYNLRLPRVFVPPRAKTCRSVNTFVPSLVGVRNQSWHVNYSLHFSTDSQMYCIFSETMQFETMNEMYTLLFSHQKVSQNVYIFLFFFSNCNFNPYLSHPFCIHAIQLQSVTLINISIYLHQR